MTHYVLCLYALVLSVISFLFFSMERRVWFKRIRQWRQLSMHFQSVCGFFCISVLLANSVWSWELNNFHWVRSDQGDLVCGMSKPNKTLKDIGSRAQCMAACFNDCPSPCQAVNYWTNAKRCQHFYYIPCYYAVKEDCINYQVTTALSRCGVYVLDCSVIRLILATGFKKVRHNVKQNTGNINFEM